jgi:alkanesulfonate monooxygenase SsuD/methylene tetrahydromethanopterin reductase-like flavin-dependent oxidoreductase (luciferase family)
LQVRCGVAFWLQRTTWPALRDAAIAADQVGLDSVWVNDHLLSGEGAWDAPTLEGWATLAAVSGLTTQATVGLLVSANTFRNPGLTAKLAATVDHISGGRAILGIGAGWFVREHEAFGIDFGASPGDRIARLEVAVSLIRRLLDGERVDHNGPVYPMTDAVLAPRPLQPHLPILIGGSGPRKTLRVVAKYADAWNTRGSLEEVTQRDAILRTHCERVGRDPDLIERTLNQEGIIRDDASEAREVYDRVFRSHGIRPEDAPASNCGSPSTVAAWLRPFLRAGFRHIMWIQRAPFDLETIRRLGEVRSLLEAQG